MSCCDVLSLMRLLPKHISTLQLIQDIHQIKDDYKHFLGLQNITKMAKLTTSQTTIKLNKNKTLY